MRHGWTSLGEKVSVYGEYVCLRKPNLNVTPGFESSYLVVPCSHRKTEGMLVICLR